MKVQWTLGRIYFYREGYKCNVIQIIMTDNMYFLLKVIMSFTQDMALTQNNTAYFSYWLFLQFSITT